MRKINPYTFFYGCRLTRSIQDKFGDAKGRICIFVKCDLSLVDEQLTTHPEYLS